MKRYQFWKNHRLEAGLVALLLALAWGVRYIAAVHTGIEVDEPIYRYASAYAARYGFPSVRAASNGRTIPFLYHPPFFLLLLAKWFQFWHSDSFLTGRLLNVCISTLMLALLYLFVRVKIGRVEALLALLLVGGDSWVIFTNQGIYLENSLLFLILLAVWAYWWATEANVHNMRHVIMRYIFAGFLIGCVLDYKQIGGYLLVVVLIHWLLFQRRHHLGHLLLLVTAFGMLLIYLLVMHLSFGSLFDSATLDQLVRTLGLAGRTSAGLTYSPLVALQALGERYWIFLSTILILLGGSILAVKCSIQHLFGKGQQESSVILSWALGGVIFALSISLKSPHYIILWLVPLYLLVIQQGCQWLRQRTVSFQFHTWVSLLLSLLLLLNVWSFQARFLHVPGDALAKAEAYINASVPATATVVTEDYIGVDLHAQYININFAQTPQKIYHSDAGYLALYWSTTEPIPVSLGNIASYCTPLETFTGFKDHIEVCRVNRLALAKRYRQ